VLRNLKKRHNHHQQARTKIQNIVASGGLGGLIDLEKAAYTLGHSMYEPEQFLA